MNLCLFCRNFSLSFGDGGWSEYTPGYPPRVSCSKNVWPAPDYPTQEEFARLLIHAENCQYYDYLPLEEIRGRE